jgi:uncharacterized protein (UPF0303 family)
MTTSIERDLEKIVLQESRLVFKQFDAKVAWVLGCELHKLAESLEASVVIDISLHDRQLFHVAMPGTSADNADWVRRKRNTVLRCHKSPYGIGQKFAFKSGSFHEKTGASLQDYAMHGGGFPITLQGLGCIGAITVSGLPQREDYSLVVRVLAEYLELNLTELMLEESS